MAIVKLCNQAGSISMKLSSSNINGNQKLLTEEAFTKAKAT